MLSSSPLCAWAKIMSIEPTQPLRINSRVHVLSPYGSFQQLINNPKPLHILCGWLGGPIKSVSRYAHALSAIDPEAHVLIITSFPSDYIASHRSILKSLEPAVSIIQRRIKKHGSAQALGHLQIFSSGGGYSACMLARGMKAQPDAGDVPSALPVRSMCLDSAPFVLAI